MLACVYGSGRRRAALRAVPTSHTHTIDSLLTRPFFRLDDSNLFLDLFRLNILFLKKASNSSEQHWVQYLYYN